MTIVNAGQMAKIKITESELKRLISECVTSTLEEVKYGVDWNQLSPEEQKAAAKRYYNNGLFHPSMNNVSYTYPDNTTGVTPTKYDQATGQYQQGTVNYNMDAAKDIYNRKRARKLGKGNASYSQEQGQKIQQAADNATKQLNGLYKQLGVNTQNGEGYDGALRRINTLNQNTNALQAKNAAITALYGALNAKDQAEAMTKAKQYRMAANNWYNYQKQLKTQQGATPVQGNTQNTVNK